VKELAKYKKRESGAAMNTSAISQGGMLLGNNSAMNNSQSDVSPHRSEDAPMQ
jgi:hypothetical protein